MFFKNIILKDICVKNIYCVTLDKYKRQAREICREAQLNLSHLLARLLFCLHQHTKNCKIH